MLGHGVLPGRFEHRSGHPHKRFTGNVNSAAGRQCDYAHTVIVNPTDSRALAFHELLGLGNGRFYLIRQLFGDHTILFPENSVMIFPNLNLPSYHEEPRVSFRPIFRQPT